MGTTNDVDGSAASPCSTDVEPWQQRLYNERRELTGKIDKLRDFIEATNREDVFGTLDEAEQVRIQFQFSVMELYRGVISARIAAFESQSVSP